MAVFELFRALGDSTRLEIVRRLSTGQPHTISTISNGLAISRQGARKHIQILADAKLIKLEPRGRDTDVFLEHEALHKVQMFMANLERQWDERLEALRTVLDKE